MPQRHFILLHHKILNIWTDRPAQTVQTLDQTAPGRSRLLRVYSVAIDCKVNPFQDTYGNFTRCLNFIISRIITAVWPCLFLKERIRPSGPLGAVWRLWQARTDWRTLSQYLRHISCVTTLICCNLYGIPDSRGWWVSEFGSRLTNI